MLFLRDYKLSLEFFEKILPNKHKKANIIFLKIFLNFSAVVVEKMFGKKKRKPQISGPTNFEHRVHTGFDHQEGK